jgi:hypothetical protein
MRFLNFIKAWCRYHYAKWCGYDVIAPPGVASSRFGLCQQCPFFDGAECELCGCLAMAKTLILTEHCPKGLWLAEWRKSGRNQKRTRLF